MSMNNLFKLVALTPPDESRTFRCASTTAPASTKMPFPETWS
jgi:hypothetical protein